MMTFMIAGRSHLDPLPYVLAIMAQNHGQILLKCRFFRIFCAIGPIYRNWGSKYRPENWGAIRTKSLMWHKTAFYTSCHADHSPSLAYVSVLVTPDTRCCLGRWCSRPYPAEFRQGMACWWLLRRTCQSASLCPDRR